jgi:hypothetical protein
MYETNEKMRIMIENILDDKELLKKILAFFLVISINWMTLSSVLVTFGYFSDTEKSQENKYVATNLDFVLEGEEAETDNCFWTYTQGGWSSPAAGNNPGAYRDNNFNSAFPSGVTIGDEGGYTALFTSAGAVENFLPAGGSPGPLLENHKDPLFTGAGVLAGQILALSLNIGFDLYDPDFAPSINNLEDFVLSGSETTCDGMTAGQVLEQGNLVLAGLGGSFSASEINDCATWINERFVDNECGSSLGEPVSQTVKVSNIGSLGFHYKIGTEKTGGDDEFCNALQLEAKLEGESRYSGNLFGSEFPSDPVVYSDPFNQWEFIVSVPEGSSACGVCNYDFVFTGWQIDFETFGGFNDTERISDRFGRECSSCNIEVTYPNGGETWYIVPSGAFNGLGQYDIQWNASSDLYDDEDLDIDIWFCKDSGNTCFHKIATSTENDGSYLWTIPYDAQFITDEARVKIVATDPNGKTCEDMSDEDFCPPMLTEEELTDLLLSVHSVRDLMSVKVVKGTSTNETSQDDSLFDELEKEDPETGDNIDPLNNTTEPQNGLNDIFGLNEGNGGIGNLTDPLDTTTPPEDGVNGQEEEEEGNNPFNLEGEDNSLGKLEDPIITVTSGEDGIED